MKDRSTISSAQLILLTLGSRVIVAYTYLPIMNIPPGNQDAWIVALLAIPYSILLCIPVLFLSNRFRGLPVQTHSDAVLGKFFGRVETSIYAGLFIFKNVVFILLAIVFINSSVFPETPPWAIVLYIFVPVVYASLKGAQTIARLAVIIVPYVIMTIVLFFVLSLPDMEFSNLKPVLADSTFLDLNIGAFLTSCLFADVLIFPIFSMNYGKNVNINKSFIYSLLGFTGLFILIIISTITVIGVDFAQRAWNPYYFFTRQVSAYDFIQRVESLNILGWFMAILMRLALYNYIEWDFQNQIPQIICGADFSCRMCDRPSALG